MSDSLKGILAGLLVLLFLMVCATGENGKTIDQGVQDAGDRILVTN